MLGGRGTLTIRLLLHTQGGIHVAWHSTRCATVWEAASPGFSDSTIARFRCESWSSSAGAAPVAIGLGGSARGIAAVMAVILTMGVMNAYHAAAAKLGTGTTVAFLIVRAKIAFTDPPCGAPIRVPV